jgi:hypothetical protein
MADASRTSRRQKDGIALAPALFSIGTLMGTSGSMNIRAFLVPAMRAHGKSGACAAWERAFAAAGRELAMMGGAPGAGH